MYNTKGERKGMESNGEWTELRECATVLTAGMYVYDKEIELGGRWLGREDISPSSVDGLWRT